MDNIFELLCERPSLGRRDRSLITIAILATSGSQDLEWHLRSARNSGILAEEIVEVLEYVKRYVDRPLAEQTLELTRAVYADESD